ncbi:MAG: rhomboid family intramembrane serine protease [Tannerella sp.]|jgi:membrane associated rhomboid family serine protease|nr:rhomboid family intramembrane serine protease [Tannerella sp.]
MANIFTEIAGRYKAGSILAKYIYINAAVFILIRLTMIVLDMMLADSRFAVYLQAPSSLSLLMYRPWTVFTYMFVHLDFLHVLFNLLWLYFFGKLFLQFFTGRQFGGLYVLGGLAGVALFLLAYNTFPPLMKTADFSFLTGASASVMAIVFAVSFYRKDYMINLLLIGRIRLLYIAIGVLLIDILAITSENAGGHIAHIGGAMLGIIFATQYTKGKDITNFINRWIDRLVNTFNHKPRRFGKKPKFKVYRNDQTDVNSNAGARRRPETDEEYLRRKNAENKIIDDILDKLKRSGYESLSAEDKKRLFDASKK